MITIKDIAAKTGVNVSTVSRALNDSPEISEKTKAHIRKVASEMKYTPNISARSLVGKNSRSVGLILPEIRSNYYAQIANNISDELGKRDYSMIIGLTNFRREEEVRALTVMSSRQVDGILFTSLDYDAIEKELLQVKKRIHTPVVLLDSFVNKKKKKFDHIGIGSYDGIREAIRNLLDRGKTRIGFIGDRYTNLSRYPIFVRVMNEYGITPDEHLIGIGDERFEEGGYSRMIEIIRSGHRPDGLFVSYDNMAIGVLKAMHEHGLRPIEDISVIGHDNIQGSFYTYDSLSTIEPPLGKMAALVVERLIDRIHGDRSRAIEKLLPARFIDRGTS